MKRRPDIEAAIMTSAFVIVGFMVSFLALSAIVPTLAVGGFAVWLLYRAKRDKLRNGNFTSFGPDKGKWVSYLASYAVTLMLLLFCLAIVYPNFTDYRTRAQETEIKTNLATLYTAQKAFFEVYATYSDDFEALGYRQEGRLRGRIYLSSTQIPAADKSLILDENLPFASKESFRAIGVIDGSVWMIDQKKKLIKLR